MLCGSRVYVQALEGNLGAGGIEVLKLQFAHGTAVHRVSPVAAEFLHIEVVGAQADFLVGVEAHADVAVLHLGVLLQPLDSAQDFGDTGFVVGTEQGVTAGNDEFLALVVVHLGELNGVEHDAGLLAQDDRLTLILNDAGLHVVAAHVGRGVHVGNKADGGHGLVGVGGQGGKQVAVVIERDVAQTHGMQFTLQFLGKYHLARRGGSQVGEFVTLGVKLHILQKSVN